MSSKHIINCQYCFKTYKKQSCYEKHIFQCEERNKEKIPNNKQLWDMITHLTEKYNTVQTELFSLKQKIGIQNKKIDILEWLNNKEVPDNNWNNIINNFNMSICDLELIFKNGFIDGIVSILIKYLNSVDYDEVLKCYEQKNNKLYVFNENWTILSNSDFQELFKSIHHKALAKFNEYREKNTDRMENEYFQTEFNNNFIKLLCPDISFETKSMRVKNKLFNELKENFKSIELEIL
tara:strand:+ start:997 stop:1704 length:708 start_codon:yes stop_codon:yes gene_type:complete